MSSRSKYPGLVCVIAFAITFPAVACLWDYDTLRAEARGLPGIPDIITGRFERNPPLYYQMRLERAATLIASTPELLDAYDDAGVACDRLGRHDEAIAWMARKKAAMEGDRPNSAPQADHQYRYLANLGTFHAHRWFSAGANRDDLTDMQRGIELIVAAIALNPDAHFGRERYQLLAMKWIVDPPQAFTDADRMAELPSLFQADENFRSFRSDHGLHTKGNLKQTGFDDAVQGLSGLIALGNAWESVDVYFALMIALADQGDSAMAYLAELRCRELIAQGKRSLYPDSPTGEELLKLVRWQAYRTAEDRAIKNYFWRARKNADQWHQRRVEFMMTRMQQGRHPDTDSAFWDVYAEQQPLPLPNGLFGLGKQERSYIGLVASAVALATIIGGTSIWLLRRKRRSRAGVAAA